MPAGFRDATDEKKAAEDLRRQWRIFDAVLSNTPDLIYIFDSNARFIYANRALLSVWQRTYEDAVGKTCYELDYTPELAEKITRQVQEVVATGQPLRDETPYTDPSGNTREYEYVFSPVFGPDGRVEVVTGSTRDMTERNRRERRDALLVRLDDAVRPLTDPDEITQTAARLLGEHLEISRCAYADVEDDEITFNLVGDYNRDVPSIVGRYTISQFGESYARLMQGNLPYVVEDTEADPRTEEVREAYRNACIRSVVAVPLHKAGRFVAGMAVHQITPRRWRTDEVELVWSVGNRCWESIERTRTTRELRESEARFRNLADNAPVMVWVTDADAACTYLNRNWYEFTGQTEETALGFGWLDATHPEDRAEAERTFLDANARREPFRLEYRIRRHDGAWRWAIDAAAPRFGPDRTFLGYVGSVIDITDRREAEVALAERARLAALGAETGAVLAKSAPLSETLQQCAEALVRHLHAGFARIWTLAPAGNILELQASAGLYTHLNGPHARVPVGSLKVGRIAQERVPYLTNDVAHDTYVSDPAWAEREGMVAFAGYPLVVEDRLVGVLALFADHPLPPDTLSSLESVSASIAVGIERKRAEEELSRKNEELTRANKGLEEFAYVVSHDLQEPLRMVNSYSQLLLRRLGPQSSIDLEEYAGYVRTGVKRMEALIQDLLTYSRTTLPQEELAAGRAELEAALQQALTCVDTSLRENQAALTSDPLPAVAGDEGQLVHVFQNLLSNALKYRKREDPPRIHIGAERVEEHWVISVKDNGIGFEQHQAERIFGLFKRLHRDNEYPGTGLGLSICRRIVERFGGKMWAESEPGAGSTFYFSLPAAS